MKSFLAVLVFSLTTVTEGLTLATRQSASKCCFGISAIIPSSPNATIGQLSDGQNRIGGGLTPATFCLTGTSITDKNGRGCIITSPETQYQCDAGKAPSSGFSIGCNGLISHSGSTVFWQCQTGDSGEANIYTTPGGTNCQQIELAATGGSCAPNCAPPAPPPPPPPAPPAQPPKSCTPNWSSFQYPHLIIPIDSSNPNTANGTSYFGFISPTLSTIYNFDIPSSYAGKTCSLVFLLPAQSSEQTSSFTFSGNGKLSFSELNGVANSQTTWNNRPSVKTGYPDVTVSPGGSTQGYTVASFACPAGETVAFEIGEGQGGSTVLKYFQDFNPSALGVFIFPC